MVKLENVFDLIAQQDTLETVGPVVDTKNVRVEVIRSIKPNNPQSGWYDQNEDEFVMVIKGSAELEFQNGAENQTVQMRGGDYMTIPAHLKHRVTKVSDNTY